MKYWLIILLIISISLITIFSVCFLIRNRKSHYEYIENKKLDIPPCKLKGKKVISFSLYGKKEKYTIGAIENAIVAPKIYPGWICRYYIGSDVPKEILEALQSFSHVEIIHIDSKEIQNGRFWRFLMLFDDDTSVFISRDTDSILNNREKIAVDEWLGSSKKFHIMRDHPHHDWVIMGGMWGCKGSLHSLKPDFDKYKTKTDYTQDQMFLKNKVYPVIAGSVMVHASSNKFEPHAKNFRTKDDYFVGRIEDDFPKAKLLLYIQNNYNIDFFANYIYNNTLPPIFIINLKDSRGEKRRESLKNNVLKHEVNLIMSSATDKNIIAGKQDHKSKKTHGRILSKGEIALVHSHSNLLIFLLNSDLPYLLIAEDDICVSKTFNIKLQNVLSTLPNNFDVIKLEYCDHDPKKVLNKADNIEYKNGHEFWVHGAGLYIISRKGAEKILLKNSPYAPWCAADGSFLHCLDKKDVYTTLPPLGWQSNYTEVFNNGTHR